MTENFLPPVNGPENGCPFPDYRVAAMLINSGSQSPDIVPPVVCTYVGMNGLCGNTVKVVYEENLHGEMRWHTACIRPDGTRVYDCDASSDAVALETMVDPGFDPLKDFLGPDNLDTNRGDD